MSSDFIHYILLAVRWIFYNLIGQRTWLMSLFVWSVSWDFCLDSIDWWTFLWIRCFYVSCFLGFLVIFFFANELCYWIHFFNIYFGYFIFLIYNNLHWWWYAFGTEIGFQKEIKCFSTLTIIFLNFYTRL